MWSCKTLLLVPQLMTGMDLTRKELLLHELRVYAPCQTPQPLRSALERQGPKTSGFENPWSLCPGDSQRTGIPFVKGLCTNSLVLRHSTKTTVWKMPRPCVKEIHLLIVEHLEGQEAVGTLWGHRCWQVPFLHSPFYLASVGTDGCHFCTLLLIC